MSLSCLLLGHQRSRKVVHDGRFFRSHCRRCDTAMMKDALSGQWRIAKGHEQEWIDLAVQQSVDA